jgi:hypothetical protein
MAAKKVDIKKVRRVAAASLMEKRPWFVTDGIPNSKVKSVRDQFLVNVMAGHVVPWSLLLLFR